MYVCSLCDYESNRKNDWIRHKKSYKHINRHLRKTSKYNCAQCGYCTNRLHNLQLHFCSVKHTKNYLKALLNNNKVSEKWEIYLISKRGPCKPVEEFLLTNFSQPIFCFKTSIAKAFSGPIEIRPIIVISKEYFVVKRKNRWYRLSRTGFLSLLKKVVVIHVSNNSNQDDNLIIALRWSNDCCHANGDKFISQICFNALQQELDREKVRSTRDLITHCTVLTKS